MRLTLLVLLAVLSVLAAACTDSSPPAAGPTESAGATTASETDAAGPTATPSSAEDSQHVPDVAVVDQLGWVLSVLNGAELDQTEFDQRFAALFRDQISFEDFLAPLEQVRAAGPFSLGQLSAGQANTTVALLDTPAGPGQLAVTIGVEDDGAISTLFLGPGEPPTLEDRPDSIGEAVQRLQSFGELTFATALVEGSECRVLTDIGADDPAPIGSAFKLYVLAAVADAIETGDLAWDDTLVLTEDVISLPSGALQDQPVGTEVSVEEAADLMISISDNTATDLLLRTVGRDAVEAALATSGHAQPDLNIPFLTTLEAFVLKTDDAVGDAWVDGDESERRQVLAEIADVRAEEVDVTAFLGAPVRPDEIEWFASPMDLCRVLASLLERAANAALTPLEGILTGNPGVPPVDERWDSVAFKGGSEPGLLAVAWLVDDGQGARRFIGGSVLDLDAAITDETQAILLFAAARDLLADS